MRAPVKFCFCLFFRGARNCVSLAAHARRSEWRRTTQTAWNPARKFLQPLGFMGRPHSLQSFTIGAVGAFSVVGFLILGVVVVSWFFIKTEYTHCVRPSNSFLLIFRTVSTLAFRPRPRRGGGIPSDCIGAH